MAVVIWHKTQYFVNNTSLLSLSLSFTLDNAVDLRSAFGIPTLSVMSTIVYLVVTCVIGAE